MLLFCNTKPKVLIMNNIFLKIATAISILIITNSCAIKPTAWHPEKPTSIQKNTKEDQLLKASKIDLNGWLGPEDIVFDSLGNLYCGVHNEDFTDGCILKIDNKGNIEKYYNAGSWVAGLHFDKNYNLIALSHKEGLISINANKETTILANKDENGNKFLIPNGLEIASDGKIYFTNTSQIEPYTIKYGKKLILEMIPRGALYCYDPISQKITTLINGTYFGNGIVLSKDESYFLMVETSKYRIIKYWLKGDKKGTSEVFIDNLPGFPNGISIRENGTYWLGFTTIRNEALDKIHPKVGMKKFVYGLPEFLQPKATPYGMVINLSSDGTILETLLDTKGVIITEAGAVKEQNGFIYIGGDVMPFIGKYNLKN